MKQRNIRGIKWRVPFKTLKERDAVVCIYEENYNGDIIDLEGAINPITTEDDNSEELLSPVRSQTGYLRVIDNGDLAGLIPSDNMQHYVELYISGVLEWCGYMQADTFSEDWDATPIEVELPLISGLGVLDGLYLDQHLSFGEKTLAGLLRECCDMSNIDYDNVYIPSEGFPKGEDSPALLRLKVSRYNFFNNSEAEYDDIDYQKYDAWKAKEVIDEICRFFGWSLYERGKSLFFVSHGGNGKYRQMSYADFGKGLNTNEVTPEVIDLYSLDYDGDSHTVSILQGHQKFKIEADYRPVGDVVPLIDKDALGKKGIKNITYSTNVGQPVRAEQIKLYGGGAPELNTEMFQYKRVPNDGFHAVPYDENEYQWRIGCCFAESDLYEPEELQFKQNYDYKAAILVCVRDVDRQIIKAGTKHDYPFLKMRNSAAAKYKSGAFVLSASRITCLNGLRAINMLTTTYSLYLNMSFKIGDKYWDGQQWADSLSYFDVHVTDKGKIENKKLLSMPYNGADGYIIPIDMGLSGDVELILYAFESNDLQINTDRIDIEGLKVEYHADDNETDDDEVKINKYQTLQESSFTNEMEVKLKMATYNKNKAGYGLITLDDNYVEELQYDGMMMRPEKFLLSKLKQIYGRNIEKLDIEVSKTNLLPYDLVTAGKKYAIARIKTDWSDEHQSLTLMDVK